MSFVDLDTHVRPRTVDGLVTDPWGHQVDAMEWIAERGGSMLAHEMGTGKTLSVIGHVAETEPERTLIICPKVVVPVWPAEFKKHTPGLPLSFLSMTKGTARKKAAALREFFDLSGPKGVVINYDSAWRGELGKALLEIDWDLVVGDECHRAKSPGGKASRFLSRLGNPYKRKQPKRIGLTGTPMPLGPQDLYAQFRFLDHSVFGFSAAAFRAKYAIMGGFDNRKIVDWRLKDEIAAKFHSIAHVVYARDVLDLPDWTHQNRFVELEPKTRRIYEALDDEFIAEIAEGTVTVKNALTKILRLQQAVSGHTKVDETERVVTIGDEKCRALADLLEDIPADEPVIVFCLFKHSLFACRQVMDKSSRKTYEVSGACNDVGAKWEPTTGRSACLVQWQSGGVGIDLTAARYVVLYDQTHNAGNYLQGLARADRHGQWRSGTVVHLVAPDSIDTEIQYAIERKMSVVQSVIDARKKTA